jgi:hypothetical protein
MSTKKNKYCLDANVLIQAWQKYYSPTLCSDYWNVLNELGSKEIIFISEIVCEEIIRTEDDLSKWIKKGQIPIRKIDEQVTKCLQNIYAKNPAHKNLVDNTKARSLADPWVIAHALNEGATAEVYFLRLTLIILPNQ